MPIVPLANRHPPGQRMPSQTTHSILSYRWLVRLLVLVVCASAGGCYDGEALLKQAEAAALSTTLAEIDLGIYQTNLPRDPETRLFATVEVHVFGTVPRSRLAAVKKQLEIDTYRLRHDVLATIRQSTRNELSDPALANLRARISKVVNHILVDAPVREIGFYQVTLR